MTDREQVEQCSNCKFGAAIDYGNVFCRRHPPTLRQREYPIYMGESEYPRTHNEGWCGEWQAKRAIGAAEERK